LAQIGKMHATPQRVCEEQSAASRARIGTENFLRRSYVFVEEERWWDDIVLKAG